MGDHHKQTRGHHKAVMKVTGLIGASAVLAMLVMSCGGGGDQPPPLVDGIVSGVAMDGPIAHAIISIQSWTSGDTLATTVTDEAGAYAVQLNAPSQWISLVLTDGSYKEDIGGRTINLTRDRDYLRAAFYYNAGETHAIPITYATHLAAGRARYLQRVEMADAVDVANGEISNWLGLDIIDTLPTPITTAATTPETLYGLATAAISDLTRRLSLREWPQTAIHSRLSSIGWAQQAYDDIQFDGRLDGTGGGGQLFVGQTPITTAHYRYETARSLLVVVGSGSNLTGVTVNDAMSMASAMALSTESLFGDDAPIPLTLDDLAPVVTLELPALLSGVIVVAPVVISPTATEIASVRLTIGKIDFGEAADPLLPQWEINTATLFADGRYPVTVEAIDLAKRTGSVTTATEIANAPLAVMITPLPNTHVKKSAIVNLRPTTSPTLLISNVDVVTGGIFTPTTESTPGVWSHTLHTEAIPDGLYISTYRVEDSGNRNLITDHPLVIDNTLPLVIIDVDDNVWHRGLLRFSITVTEDNINTATLFIAGELVKNLTSGINTIDINTADYVDGAHSVVVDVTDKAGNQMSRDITLRIDNTPPDVAFIVPVSGDSISNNVTFRIKYAETASGLVNPKLLYFNGIATDSAGFSCSTESGVNILCTKSFSVDPWNAGFYDISARLVDAAGNAGVAFIYNVHITD